MARRRDKELLGLNVTEGRSITARSVSCTKRMTINIGDYQSYSLEYGLEDVAEPGETNKQAFKRLKKDIEEALIADLKEIPKMAEVMNKSRPKKKGR